MTMTSRQKWGWEWNQEMDEANDRGHCESDREMMGPVMQMWMEMAIETGQ